MVQQTALLIQSSPTFIESKPSYTTTKSPSAMGRAGSAALASVCSMVAAVLPGCRCLWSHQCRLEGSRLLERRGEEASGAQQCSNEQLAAWLLSGGRQQAAAAVLLLVCSARSKRCMHAVPLMPSPCSAAKQPVGRSAPASAVPRHLVCT